MLFNLFINVVDLHELFVGAHTDYPLVRNTFGGSDLLIFYRDLMRKAADRSRRDRSRGAAEPSPRARRST